MQAMIRVSGGACFGLGARGEGLLLEPLFGGAKCETKHSSATRGRSVNQVDL